ncbi:MAG: SusC/RagA family TonB-linked outer membrane protein [Prevotellaceae bacterium]|jgi:TonB-linked SusC/RagA family outer membrane protein|nr:SusC/RagA family TonB-linked outer membrane protein [Prevotellaceae bacterium]
MKQLQGERLAWSLLFAMLLISPLWVVGFAHTSETQRVQQAGMITGKVVDVHGNEIIGAGVLVKGTQRGTITNVDGVFSIEAQPGSVIVVSYVGYKDAEISVTSQTTSYRVTLTEDSQLLNEVVVTAMGIKKERKALGYSVSDLRSDELMRNKNTNVINSLAGKVPGVNITQSSGAAGAGASITIRGGNSSDEGRQNQPLFVIDGVIYDNSTSVLGNTNTDGMSRSNTTYSNRVMDINPEDIEDMSVLKGAAAAALYGSRAADGVVIITTKKGKEGTMQVDFASKLSTSWVTKLPEAQSSFGRGIYTTTGADNMTTYQSWGHAIDSNTPVYDNIGNFFQNGATWDNNVSISGGSKNGTFYLSASNYDQGGIVPKTGYNKTTIRFNAQQTYGRLTVGANTAFTAAKTDKTLTSFGLYGGGGNGAMTALYQWPTSENMRMYLNADGSKHSVLMDQDPSIGLDGETENPYWIINKDKFYDETRRFTGDINASFKITDWWDISGRIGYDEYTTNAYNYLAPQSVANKEAFQNGRLSKSNYRYEYVSTNFMSNMHKTFGDFDLNLLLGTTAEDTKRLNQTDWGYDFITPGTISFANVDDSNRDFTDGTTRKRLVGVYGEFRASWKSMVYLTVTGRNDWSSTLPVNNRSYFYPSVSGSFLFTQLLPQNDILTFGKLRASWAQVGKDANPYVIDTRLAPNYSLGEFLIVGYSSTSGNRYLKPEIQTSWEIGTELHFLNGRIGLDYTYYHSSTKNQIGSPRLSNANGFTQSTINSGSVINSGMEVALNFRPIDTKDWKWDMTLNWSYNRGKLGDFIDGVTYCYVTDVQYGTIKAAAIPDGGHFLAMTGTVFQKGDNEGNSPDQYAIDPKSGLYKASNVTNTIVGNREPSFIGGLNNTLSYKDLTVSLLLDLRVGGDIYNGTEYQMVSTGLAKRTLLNNRQSVTVSGVNAETGEPYEQTYEADKTYEIGGSQYDGKYMIQQYWKNYCSNSENFITSVNWLKVRSLSVSYDLTKLIRRQNIIKRLSVNATGTNLLTLTNYKGMDPEVSAAGGAGGSGSTGIDYCGVPSTSGFTFGVNLTF